MRLLRLALVLLAAALLAGCEAGSSGESIDAVASFDVRPLGADAGAAAPSDTVLADQPFVLGFDLEPGEAGAGARSYRVEVRRGDSAWTPVERSDFPYPETATPRVSVTGRPALVETAGPEQRIEWPIVIRRWSDGAVLAEDGDTFAFRLVDGSGTVLASAEPVEVRLVVPEGHLGGTFVETPGRIGPWQSDDGSLYFIMEPSETDNVLMVVKSTDGGATWREVDAANRPAADDLEGLAAAWHEGVIHILHQQSEHVWHHAFATTEAAQGEGWAVRDELVDEPGEPPVQVASLEAREDGSLVAFYGGPQAVHMRVRTPGGAWGEVIQLDAGTGERLSGPMTALASDGAIHVGYTSRDGAVWVRTLSTSGVLGERIRVAGGVSSGIDTTEGGVGSLLPLAHLPETGETALVFRESGGTLVERRLRPDGTLTPPHRVSSIPTVLNAVDSDQAGADLIAHGGALHLLQIEEGTGTLYYTTAAPGEEWSEPTAVQEDVNAQWVRGNVVRRSDGTLAYGYVFDAGSDGGSGLNRYAEVELGR
jgi:hypothetical protein